VYELSEKAGEQGTTEIIHRTVLVHTKDEEDQLKALAGAHDILDYVKVRPLKPSETREWDEALRYCTGKLGSRNTTRRVAVAMSCDVLGGHDHRLEISFDHTEPREDNSCESQC